jgi:hypothetical protein
MRGVRIQTMVRELGGEKIDIVEWDADPRTFIAHALSPAKVVHVGLEDAGERRTASVIVPDSQLSLAIGREGQNARLAAKLTGWRIDIRSEAESGDLLDQLRAEESERRAQEAIAREAERRAVAERAAAAARAAVAERQSKAAAAEAQPAATDVAAEPESATPAPAVPVAPPVTPGAKDWTSLRHAPPVIEEEDEDIGDKKGKKKKGAKGVAIKPPVTQRKPRRGEWDEDLGRWEEDDLEDLGITEYDFLADEPDEPEESDDEEA